MTSRSHIENAIRSLYAARAKGDLEGTLRDLAEDVVFTFNGRGTGVEALSAPSRSKTAFRPVLQELINHWRFDDWEECCLLVDDEKALLHWTARVTYIPTNKSENIDTLDAITFRDGKIVNFFQCTDTALVASLAVPQAQSQGPR
jgi:ketosteroid isomerase-like protein